MRLRSLSPRPPPKLPIWLCQPWLNAIKSWENNVLQDLQVLQDLHLPNQHYLKGVYCYFPMEYPWGQTSDTSNALGAGCLYCSCPQDRSACMLFVDIIS